MAAPAGLRGASRRALARPPGHAHPARSPWMAVRALDRVGPPARSLHAHQVIRTRKRVYRQTAPTPCAPAITAWPTRIGHMTGGSLLTSHESTATLRPGLRPDGVALRAVRLT